MASCGANRRWKLFDCATWAFRIAPTPKCWSTPPIKHFLVISHDVNTMAVCAYERIEAEKPMGGLFMVHQWKPIGPVIDSLILIWAASEAEEWRDRVVFLP